MPVSPNGLLEAYVEMGLERLEMGFDLTLLSIMFRELGGSDAHKTILMHSAVEHLYSRHLTRVIRQRNSTPLMNMPFWIVCDDWPVPKREKDHFVNIAVNDGRHMHALAFTPPQRRIARSLEHHFDENHRIYCPEDLPIQRVHSRPITETPAKAMRYGLKSLQRQRIDAGDVFVLPRDWSEMSGGITGGVTPRTVAQERRFSMREGYLSLRVLYALHRVAVGNKRDE